MNVTADVNASGSNIGHTSTPLQSNILRLHNALLHYATVSTRIFYVQDDSAWDDFETDIKPYNDLTSRELRNMFINDVLPQVFLLKLPEVIKKRLEILLTHPCYRRTAHGFRYVPAINKQLEKQLTLKPNVDFCLPNHLSKGRTFHTLLMDTDEHHNSPAGYNCQLSPTTVALFSAMLATDQELFLCQLQSPAEIHRRLRNAKKLFEESGIVTPYRSNIDHLCNHLKTFVQLKTKVCETLSTF